jgi:hypothetical protein
LLAFTINLQGGSPQGYSRDQPWETGAFFADGRIREEYLKRLETILDRADELGLVAIVGYFYFGQDQRIRDEAAVRSGVQNATQWLLSKNYRNVLVEIANECDVRYDHDILKPARVDELIRLAKSMSSGGRRLLVGVSFGGGRIPTPNVIRISDFLLLHGNGVGNPRRVQTMVEETRQQPGYRPVPILFNEDDHFDFDRPVNNMLKAIESYASWGYFDPGSSNYSDGFQCPPVNWRINTERKKGFFGLLKEVTGA